uniref:HAT C-terminal dimerisation domain-containing protein n=1 Tax=Fusarium oxysporum (strain Fo5176) TaxID=660025 RepID=A0A0D2XRS9_FUSOF
MALDLLSVPPMSAECERLFSVAGQMVSPLRTRLEASTIGDDTDAKVMGAEWPNRRGGYVG